jgi:predicted DNA-binding mobile mystery protein A
LNDIFSIAYIQIVAIISICEVKREKVFAMATRDQTKRAREALDKRTAPLHPVSRYAAPHRGWVRAVRDALGMSAADLGRRMGISGASVRSIEQKERTGGVRLSTLQRAAEAMDCTLVYALVPNESLEATARHRAQDVLDRHWRRAYRSMALEDQATDLSDAAREEQLQRILSSRGLWSDKDSQSDD